MPKWSNYIRNLGTAGPATLQGIYDLGFALRSEIPALFAKYVRVDAAQTFTSGERLQGRQNIGLGNVDNTSDANKPISTAQQTALNLKAPLESPAFTNTPTAPTPTAGNSSTRLATTAFVAGEVANRLTAASLSGAPAKATPVDADTLALSDSAASGALKALSWANLKSTLLSTIMTWTAKQTFQSVAMTTNAVDLTVGQIKFPAVQNPSSDVNTLDAYGEGTFTPTRSGFTETGGGTVSLSGRYTKIGRRVSITVGMVPSGGASVAGVAGSSVISNLPFAIVGAESGTYADATTEGLGGILLGRAGTNVIVLVQSYSTRTSSMIFSLSYDAAT